jgi:hypothetical protein
MRRVRVFALMPAASRLAEFIPPFYNNPTMPSLDELESHIQTLLEVHLLKYLPGHKPEDRIYQQLAVAMHKSLKEQGGMTYAPNIFVIVVHPSTLSRWHNVPGLVEQLADVLRNAGDEAGFHFLTKPAVTTAADPDMVIDEVHVIASFSNEDIPETQELPLGQPSDAPIDAIPPNAFLILGGTRIIPLDRPAINIGRRLDNQVVIDDPRVSRTHAQLRIAKGRYVLFDLNSSGGTYVNGHRTVQSILSPGDVISLAGVTLIFGQDLTIEQKADEITKPNSASKAAPTTLIKQKPDTLPGKKTPSK